jgi:transmembrane protein 126A
MYATRHFTYRLPSITAQPKEVFNLWWKFTKSAKTMGGVLLAVNMFAAMFVTATEMKQNAKINHELLEYEKKVDSGSLTEADLEHMGLEAPM